MILPEQFADKQLELAAEFSLYLAEHAEVDDLLPPKSHVYFEVEGEPGFNQHSRELANRRHQVEGVPLVLVRIRGLAPCQGSRLVDPVIEPAAKVA